MSGLLDARMRPPVELGAATVHAGFAVLLWVAPEAVFPLMPWLCEAAGYVLALLAVWRAGQGLALLRYWRGLRTLPVFSMPAARLPVSRHRLYLGRGFRWDQRHTQRLLEARWPSAARWLRPSVGYRMARSLEVRLEHSRVLGWAAEGLRADRWWNPLRPEPGVGGDPALHGVGVEDERDVWMGLGERVGHTLVLGTTRVGKTRLAELLIAQDIRRGETVIVFDPKGDIDLLSRMVAEARRAGRLDRFHLLHLGFPAVSERYNPVGELGRITEVASRIATQLPSAGNSAAFREFAWRFTNIVARALVGLGRKPDYGAIARYVTNVEPLLVDYYGLWLDRAGPRDWPATVDALERDAEALKRAPLSVRNRDRRAVALVLFARERNLFDPVADGLRSAFEYDRTYFDKLTASLLPLLEKLTTGPSGALLVPDYQDARDTRPVLDWMRVIREQGIVYVGLDALSDPEVASAVGNAMLADLTSVAGRLYKHGDTQGLPDIAGHRRARIALHADEFNELVGDEFIPLLNKAGGAGVQVTAYTQTLSDIEAGIGDRAKAGQVIGNLNTLVMLRVRNEETARLLTDQLPKVRVYTKVTESRATDHPDPDTPLDFVASTGDRFIETETDMVSPADLVQLPKGHAFALLEGGQLYKLRLPLAGDDPLLPGDMDAIATALGRQSAIHG